MKPLQHKKGSLGLYCLLLVAAIALMVMLRQCSGRRSQAALPAPSDTLVAAIQLSPMCLYSYGDTLGGFYYDMLRQMAAQHGFTLRTVPFSRVEDAVDMLLGGRCHVVVADLPVTAEMKERVNFTDPIVIDRQVLVQLRDSDGTLPVATQYELAGDTVTIASGSPFIPRLINLSHEIGDTIYIDENSVYGPEQLVLLTALGQVRRTVANERLVADIVAEHPRLDASVEISLNQFQSWAVCREDSVLLDSLNRWIDTFKASAAFTRLQNKYQ